MAVSESNADARRAEVNRRWLPETSLDNLVAFNKTTRTGCIAMNIKLNEDLMSNIEIEQSLRGKLADLDNERLLVKQQLDRERLATITASLIDTITSPAFIERMRQFREKARVGAKFGDAADLMSLESLRAAGADIPDDFRLTSRVFEDRETGLRLEIEPPSLIANTGPSLRWGACAGGGAATVCGCAGGSTT